MNHTTLKALRAKTQLGIAGLADANGLEQFDSDEFSNFLSRIEAYQREGISLLNAMMGNK